MARIDTRSPRVSVSIGGIELPIRGVSLIYSRYTRGQTGTLNLPPEVSLPNVQDEVTRLREVNGLKAEPLLTPLEQGAYLGTGLPDDVVKSFLPVEIKMQYLGGPVVTRRMFIADKQYNAQSLALTDRWGVWTSKRLHFVGSFHSLSLPYFLESIAAKGGAASTVTKSSLNEWIEIKKHYHLWAAESLAASIEAAFNDYGVNPISFFGPDNIWYCGKNRPQSNVVMTYYEGQHFLAAPELAERNLRYDYIQTLHEKSTVNEKWEDAHQERTIPYLRVPVVWSPWIYPGDRVNIVHSWLDSGLGTFRVASATHETEPYRTTLELESFNPYEPEAL